MKTLYYDSGNHSVLSRVEIRKNEYLKYNRMSVVPIKLWWYFTIWKNIQPNYITIL